MTFGPGTAVVVGQVLVTLVVYVPLVPIDSVERTHDDTVAKRALLLAVLALRGPVVPLIAHARDRTAPRPSPEPDAAAVSVAERRETVDEPA